MHFLAEVALMFAIVYIAAWLAVRPLLMNLKRQKEPSVEEKISRLDKLRDIEVLDQDEFEEIKDRFINDGKTDGAAETYEQYLDYLYDLKEKGFLTKEDYVSKISKLKQYCMVE